MNRIRIIVFLLLSVSLIPMQNQPTAYADHDQNCKLVVEVHEVKVKANKGDSWFGLRKGDMELYIQLSLIDGEDVWTIEYPNDEDYIQVKRDETIDTDDFRLEVDMSELNHDTLQIHIIAFDLDPLKIFGYNVENAIPLVVQVALSSAPKLAGDIVQLIAERGIESLINFATSEDLITQDAFMIDSENGWATTENQTFTTSDNGLVIEYSIALEGEECTE